ncbi:hypothetical protein B0H14DRAFT_3462977 [Mycena olivaceomarginata]|nr:hypothetical protein B0H14DRAFT_3462977 [Mycena olivaceomarginata]
MSSSPPSTPTWSDDLLSNVFSAIVQESPITLSPTTAQKRPHDDIDPGSDKEGDISIPAFTVPNPSTVQAVQCFAERKRLCAEQITELNVFIKDPAPLDGIVTAVLPYAVSPDLEHEVYLQQDGPKFWDKLDSTLAGIHAKASSDAKMIAWAFCHILEKDQDLHGVKAD